MACLPAARSVSEVTSTSQTEQLAEHVEELTIQVNTLQNQVQLLSCGITTSDKQQYRSKSRSNGREDICY